ncbi:hypothetical protein BJ138DRAFT_1017478, partial [Hygrophoropsis aurantiaca]
MLNSFTDLVTFLFRCNTDVTSLLSGTAIKAVIAYISDYISKPSLRTYVVFDTIKSVYDRNASLFSGTLERAEKARKIMTQIVNSLTSKMEIGAPMASLYLLGNPDHYTSHSFNTFYWKGYVSEVRRYFITDPGEKDDEDSIVLKRIADSVVGTSPVFDYIYRPDSFESMSLYDWVSLSEKRKISRSKSIPVDEDDTGSTKRTCKFSDFYQFLDKHPLHDTHHVRILINSDGKVPNFVGGPLPRHDKGDLDYYSCTMLTLFAPWRTGFDLKTVDETWNDKFKAYGFSDRQHEVMKYFNVRYECLDARDDYSAQMREDSNSRPFPEWAGDGYPTEGDDDWESSETVFPFFGTDSIVDNMVIGKLTTKWNYDKAVVEQTLRSSGWLSPSLSTVKADIPDPVVVDEGIGPSQWKSIVKAHRSEILEDRAAGMAQRPSRHSTMGNNNFANNNPNEVCVVDHTYLNKSFKPKSTKDCLLIDESIVSFSLNEEQERAFRIIANHATMEYPGQLKMHLGGMGGTGKSRIIKALTSFFASRNESHRMITLAPTGSAAALIGGYT